MLKFLSFICLTSSLVTMLSASQIIFKGLTLPRYDQQQKLSSLLRSEEAVYKGRFTHLKNISLEIYDKNIMKITSPSGVYDSTAGTVYGESTIKAQDADMTITGKKWQVDIESGEIKIFKNLNIELTKKETEK